MPVPQHIKDECQAELERCHKIACDAYPEVDIPLPVIVYTQRGRIAGVYDHRKNIIKINPILLVENVREMVDNTVSHEFAHCADVHVHGVQYSSYNPRSGRRKRIVHGPTFKAFQRLFGRCDSTYHNMDTTNARLRTRKTTRVHAWVCGCAGGELRLTPQRHAKQLKNAPRGYGYYARGHTPKRCGNYVYLGNVDDVAPEQVKVPAKSATPRPASGLTKKELAISLFVTYPQRGEFINMMGKYDVKKTTAATYHHNVKSGKWS